ncbi:hypothetical protein F5B22DRAFT_622329 [Xylaria bambusicola]|uniref:uncharacterized protein n=1 Tax=Xylaria bambusicola TaxID=326684 RepID=UPI002007FC52|nr:uncharacterized protein F5B22DRAFT_622329 [Xylaria bambusicola]KAI0506863.1 hypothetical protein F5B22DRAFT_622329 [Xylaria bambusicola]
MFLINYGHRIRRNIHLRNRDKGQTQTLEFGLNPFIAELGSNSTPANPDESSCQASTLDKSPILLPPLVHGDTYMRELWNIAYEKLRVDDEALILEYEAKTCGDMSSGIISVVEYKPRLQDRTHAAL